MLFPVRSGGLRLREPFALHESLCKLAFMTISKPSKIIKGCMGHTWLASPSGFRQCHICSSGITSFKAITHVRILTLLAFRQMFPFEAPFIRCLGAYIAHRQSFRKTISTIWMLPKPKAGKMHKGSTSRNKTSKSAHLPSLGIGGDFKSTLSWPSMTL